MYNPPKIAPNKSTIKECCQDTDNLERHRVSDDKIIDVCKVCGCRHFKFYCKPPVLGTKLANT